MSTALDADGLKPVRLADLYVHRRALRGIETFKHAEVVGLHPMYLVGLTLPGHRGGPACIALVMLADGRVMAATDKPWRGKGRGTKDINDIITADERGMPANELRQLTRTWRETFGGFASLVIETASDGEAAHSLIDMYADVAGVLLQGVEHCRKNPPPPGDGWDPADAMVMAERGTVCAVHGFTPDHSLVASLRVSDEVKRAMTIAPLPKSDVLTGWSTDIAAIDSSIPGLVAEAWAVRLVSPRAAVALYRTAAERVLSSFGVPFKPRENLNSRIRKVKQAWHDIPPLLEGSALEREIARRSRVVAALDSLRERGNTIHEVDAVSVEDAEWSHSVLVELLRAVLRLGPLDRGTR